MSIYDKFAYFYSKGSYVDFSKKIVKILPALFEQFEIKPKKILDIACGEASFAISMAKRRFKVTGIDLSSNMLKLARLKAKRGNVKVKFAKMDMRSLRFSGEFDLATCWYDSLNYLLKLRDLERTFRGVARALEKNGYFIFDMNTIYGLAVYWQRWPCYIRQDTRELFEIHQPEFDHRKNIAWS